jgi:hypothetical protein
MSQMLEVKAPKTIEQGSITFHCRPRIEEHTDESSSVQRLLIVMSPEESSFERLIAVGRKRLPRASRRSDRFWGFVDLVLTAEDMKAALGAQMYGQGQLPAARMFAGGTYEIAMNEGRAHLRWHVEHIARDPIAFEVQVEKDADYVLTIANPNPSAWGLRETPDLQRELFHDLELHVLLPTPFPPTLQQRFGTRRFAPLDSTEWLDHPGAEIVFIGTHP